MNNEVNEAIAELEESIADANKHIELLKQFEQLAENGLSEDDYHTFCETDLRNSDPLGEALVKVLPFLTYEKRGANYFLYRLREKGYSIRIPSFCCKYIEIVVDEYYRDKKTIIKDVNLRYLYTENEQERKIAEKEAFLSTRSVFKRSRIVYPYLHPVISFFAYVFTSMRRKSKDEISSELVDLYKKKKETADKKSELIHQGKLNREAQQAALSHYVPLLLEWTDKVLVYQKGWDSEAMEIHKRDREEQTNEN